MVAALRSCAEAPARIALASNGYRFATRSSQARSLLLTSAPILSPQMKRVATDVKVIELKGSGHWLMEERPQETMDALIEFL